ncbi:MAG: nucleotidyl transferase AbiEii/AbiGii toxin family protein, partial [Planctomycetota bacterium]
MAASVASLAAFEIQYALIGGLATSLRSQPRFTKDIDFLLKIPSLVLPGLLEDLLSRGFTFDLMTVVREWNQRQMVVMSYQGVRVDWLKPILPT